MSELKIEKLKSEQIAELEAKHGPIYVSETGQGPLYFRRPTLDEIQVSRQVADKTDALEGANQLGQAVIVHPSRAELQRLIQVFPLFLDNVSSDIFAVARGFEEKRAKKSLPVSPLPETT